MDSGKQDIRLLVVNNITKFFKESQTKNKNYAASMLKIVLGILCKTCLQNKIALVCTGDANITSKGVIPRPIGGTYLKHAVNVIVHFEECISYPQSLKATLIKHQYSKTPKSIVVNTRRTGRMCYWTVLEMDRIAPSFRQLYEETISDFKTELQAALVDLGHKSAFDLLLKEAWNPEQAAMGNSTLPTICDKLNVMASIHNRN